ncbi:MAG: hypothetical protein J0H65_14405 [Rhizobiales bacterium]|nr:hypothetical protein [Hyphomicrobiales bacterium]
MTRSALFIAAAVASCPIPAATADDAGQAKGFANYSGGLTDDITWDEATLDKFIADPKSLASNTTMTPFAGIPDAAQRKLIIDYLKTQNKDS